MDAPLSPFLHSTRIVFAVAVALTSLIHAGAQNTRFSDATRTNTQNPKFNDALRAANGGDPRAEFIVGMMLVTGDGTPQDIGRGSQWLDKSARAGIPQAMVNLANLYDAGAGVQLDTTRADQWRQRAADLGDPTARGQIADDRRMPGQHDFRRANTLADLKLYTQAFPYAQRAATAGSVNAGLLLGRFYHFGIGVPVNLQEAVRWYRQSA